MRKRTSMMLTVILVLILSLTMTFGITAYADGEPVGAGEAPEESVVNKDAGAEPESGSPLTDETPSEIETEEHTDTQSPASETPLEDTQSDAQEPGQEPEQNEEQSEGETPTQPTSDEEPSQEPTDEEVEEPVEENQQDSENYDSGTAYNIHITGDNGSTVDVTGGTEIVIETVLTDLGYELGEDAVIEVKLDEVNTDYVNVTENENGQHVLTDNGPFGNAGNLIVYVNGVAITLELVDPSELSGNKTCQDVKDAFGTDENNPLNVQLTGDVTLTDDVSITLTAGVHDLYLNGKTLSAKSGATQTMFVIGTGVTLNIYGGADADTEDSGVITSFRSLFNVSGGGVLNIFSGSLTSTGQAALDVNQGGEVNISGGSITSNNSYALNVSQGTANISGGTFTGKARCINVTDAPTENSTIVNISGGSFTATKDNNGDALYVSKGIVNISGGTFTGTNYSIFTTQSSLAKVNVVGGTFTGKVKQGSGATLNIAGGTFSVDPSTYLLGGSTNWTVDHTTDPTKWIVTANTYNSVHIDSDGTMTGKSTASDFQNAFGTDGMIVMLKDITANVSIASGNIIVLDLNGHVLKGDGTASVITNYGTLTLIDSDTAAEHYFTYVEGGAWTLESTTPGENIIDLADFTLDKVADDTKTYHIKVSGGVITGGTGTLWSGERRGGSVYNNGTFTMYGGTISGNKNGGVYSTGTFTMNGGSISGNSGDGVHNYKGTFTMNGGSISGNSGDGVQNEGTFTMYGGSISGNTADCGGGVSMGSGQFTMNGGSITGNTADCGGGVFMGSGTFTMYGGSVSGNTADCGGGVFIANGTFTMSNGSISGNTATGNGGGVFMESDWFTMDGGEISGNTATGNGGGVFMGSGQFTMDGGEISGNTATNGGGVYIGDGTFRMGGGEISGNTATNGGGVYIGDGTFRMGGGEISGNKASSSTVNAIGGGVYNNGEFTMVGGKISGNTATDGGGVASYGMFSMSNGEISGNNADCGGGVYIGDGSFTMEDGTIESNSATEGGGVFMHGGTFTMEDGTIESNSATGTNGKGGGVYGGGMDNGTTTFTMNGGKIKDNSATGTNGKGGGVYSAGFTMTGGEIVNNDAFTDGGGVFIADGGTFNMTGGSICENTATGKGGGVYNYRTFNMTGGSIYNNRAVNGGGVYGSPTVGGTAVIKDNYSSSTGAKNNLYMDGWASVATDVAPADGMEIWVTLESGTGKVAGSSSADYKQYFHSDNDAYIVYNEKDEFDPSYNMVCLGVAVAELNGSTKYLTVQEAVDAVGAGAEDDKKSGTVKMLADSEENVTIGQYQIIVLNLNGKTLTADSGEVITVNGALTVIGGDTGTVVGSLKADGGTLTVESGRYNGSFSVENNGTIVIKGGLFTADPDAYTPDGLDGVINTDAATMNPYKYTVAKAVATNGDGYKYAKVQHAVDALGAGTADVKASGTVLMIADSKENVVIGQYQIITLDLNGHVLKGDGTASVITNNGTLTLNDSAPAAAHSGEYESLPAGGVITGGSATDGGGVYNGGTFTMNGGTISGNSAGRFGGGVYNSGTMTVGGSSVINGNSAYNGGGVYSTGSFTMGAGTISGNTATRGNGGGVNNWGTFTMNGGSISGNTANDNSSGGGGGVFNGEGSTFTMNNGSISGNTAVYGGGGVYNYKGTFAMTAGSISGNTAVYGGGVYNNGIFNMEGSISGNEATYGGGVCNTSIFNMADGSISANSAFNGGGVINYNAGTLNMAGGSISGNSATNAGGVFNNGTFNMLGGSVSANKSTNEGGVYNNGTMTVGGKAVIKGNKLSDDTTESNLCLPDGKTVTVGTDGAAPVSGMEIWVTIGGTPAVGSPIAVTGVNVKDYSDLFRSDNADYIVDNISNTVYIGIPVAVLNGTTEYLLVQNAVSAAGNTASTVRMLTDSKENVTVGSSQVITLDLNGHVLKGDGTASVITNNGTLTLTDSDTAAEHYFTYVKGGAWTLESTTPAANIIDLADFTLDKVADDTKTYYIKVSGGVITGGIGTPWYGYLCGGGVYSTGMLTVNGGNIIGNSAAYRGGGVYSTRATISGGVIAGNTADSGGGITMNGRGNPFTMSGGKICGNSADYSGGGIYIYYGILTMTGGEISGNSANRGGGVFNYDSFTMSGGKISGNSANRGGGLYNYYPGTMSGGEISGNTADYGGGVYNYDSFTMNSGKISGNTAKYDGGGVYNYSYPFTMNGGEISGNTAAQYGGGVLNDCGNFTMNNGTVTGNTAMCGGGVLNYNGSFTLKNGTVTGNKATLGGGVYDCGTMTVGGTAKIKGNTLSDGTTASNLYLCSGKTVTVDTPASGMEIWVSTEVAPTAGNPVAVTGANSAILVKYFTGDNASYTVLNSEDNVVRLGFPVAQIGEIKYGTVQSAINVIGAGTADSKASGTVLMIADSKENVTVGQYQIITLDLNGHVLSGDGTASVITNNGELTIIDGSTGGVITGGKATHGGGVNNSGTFIMNGGTISGNTATSSGGGVNNSGTFIMNGGTISGNTAAEWFGGGVCTTGTFTMNDGSITGNSAAKIGGGVYSQNTFNMTGGSISGNSAFQSGGVNINGTFNMTGGSISGNSADCCGGVCSYGNMTVGGTAVIKDNTLSDGTTASNLYLLSGKTVTVDTPASGMEIWVSTMTTPAVGSPVAIANANGNDCKQYFHSDNSSYIVGISDDVVYLGIPAAELNGTKYVFVQEAVDAAGDTESTVKMIDSSTENVTIAAKQLITLDLGGKILSGNVNVSGDGSLTVVDSAKEDEDCIGGIYGSLSKDKEAKIALKAGFYSEEPDSAFVAGGYEAVKNTDKETMDKFGYKVVCAPVEEDYNKKTNLIVDTTDAGCSAVAVITGDVAQVTVLDENDKVTDPKNVEILEPAELLKSGAKTAEIRMSDTLSVVLDIKSAMCGKSACVISIDRLGDTVTVSCDGSVIFAADLSDIIEQAAKLVYDGTSLKAFDKDGKLIKEYKI